MAGYVEERRSGAAVYCQRFGFFLIPYFLLVILLYRLGAVQLNQILVLSGLGFLIAIMALVFGIRAIMEIWSRGWRGGSMVVRGILITLFVLLPFAFYAFLALRHPLANDVSTDTFSPPRYVSAEQVRASGGNGLNPVRSYDDDYADLIVISYPRLQSRRYPAGPERVLEAVRAVIAENEWPVSGTRGVPEPIAGGEIIEGETVLEGAPTTAPENGEEAPSFPDDIFVEFVDRTPIFGFENDVVVRIITEDRNTLVDMRSSSRWGEHDFGYNARLIREFLNQLDEALLGIAGEG